MRKILSAALAVALFLTPFAARASDQAIVYPAQVPQSSTPNQQARYDRNALGTVLLHALALQGAGSGAGTFANLTVSPGTGLFVTVAPSNANTFGAIYQVGQSDPLPLPTNAPVATPSPLAPDTTLIAIPAFINTTSSPLGPLTAPGSNSVYWLVETQSQRTDTNLTSSTFQNTKGQPYSASVNLKRKDLVVYQIKSGTVAASPTPPAADSGYIPIAKILVPAGKSQILTGDITMYPAWTGWLQANSAINLSASPSPSPNAGNAAITGTFSASSFYGDGFGITDIQPSAFATCVPQSKGGTGTCAPTWIASGSSGNIVVSGSGPNQTVDFTQNPTITGTAAINNITSNAGIHQTGTVLPGFLSYGAVGVASSDVIRFGTSASGSGYTSIGAANDGTVSGIQNSVLSLGNSGTKTLAIDNAGDLGVLGNVAAVQGVFSGAVSGTTYSGTRGAFTGGVGLDGNAAPTNGITGGVTNTTSFKFTAAGGASTSEQFVFNYGTACPTATSGLASFTANGTPAAKFWCEGGLALDGNTNLPASGIIGGVANTTPFLITAAGGSTTTEGFRLAYSGSCNAVGNTALSLTVNGSTEFLTKCNGNVVATGTVTGTGLQATALTSIACLGTDSSGNIISNVGCVGAGSISSISAGSNIVVTGTTAVTIAATNAPTYTGQVTAASLNLSGGTASDCMATDGSLNVVYGNGCLNSLTAGSNMVVGTGPSPSVAVTGAPTFPGTVTDSNATPLALSATGGATITTAATGSANALTLNATGGTTGDLLDANLGGTNKLKVLNSGGVTSQGSFTGTAIGLDGNAASTDFDGAVGGFGSGFFVVSGDGDGVNLLNKTASCVGSNTVVSFGYGSTRAGAVYNASVGCDGTIATSGHIKATMSGGVVQGAVPPTFTLTGTSAASTEHCVEGVVAGAATTTTVSWNAAQAFAAGGTYSIYMAEDTGLLETAFTSGTTTGFVATVPATVSGHNYFVRVCGQ